MRCAAIVREATRDVSTGTSRTLVMWSLFVIAISLLVLHELFTIAGLSDRAEAFQAAGANTRIVIAKGRIDGETCDALSRQHNLESAAIRTLQNPVKAEVMSSVPLEQYVATPGIAAVLNARSLGGDVTSRAGAIVSDEVVQQLGPLTAPLATDAGEMQVAGVFPTPDDGRRAGLGFAAIYPELVNVEPYDECWITSWPDHPDALSLLNSVVLPAERSGEPAPELTQWNTTLGASFDGHQQFMDRFTQHHPYFASSLGAAIGFFALRTRRLEIAASRHARVRTEALLGMQLLQQSVWVVLGGALVTFVGAIISSGHPESAPSLMSATVRITGFAAVGALCGVSAGVVSIRETALFTYFRERR